LFLDSIQSPLAGKQRKRGRFLLLLGLCAELSKQQESFFLFLLLLLLVISYCCCCYYCLLLLLLLYLGSKQA